MLLCATPPQLNTKLLRTEKRGEGRGGEGRREGTLKQGTKGILKLGTSTYLWWRRLFTLRFLFVFLFLPLPLLPSPLNLLL